MTSSAAAPHRNCPPKPEFHGSSGSSRSSQSSQILFRRSGRLCGNATRTITYDLDDWDDLDRLDRVEFYPDDRDDRVNFEAITWKRSRKPWQRPPTGIVRLSLVSMDRPDRPDLPSHLKYYDRNDYVETLPGRSQTTRTTETTSVAWIELSSIRTIGMIV